eukprot:TRINITY_DN5000_c0_g1_i2.p2 TRINITY_DN5000_c0_g1~~TRINITY_DN5000_c0_g1_i2.p2  ORF type:complete len:281 (-),score=63.45 TRINITY_DN5000_c0_g1_i2:61-840(-)
MALFTGATSVIYLLPMIAGTGVNGQDWKGWDDGHYVDICGMVGPDWVRTALPWVMSVGGVVNSLGYIISSLCITSRLFHGVASLDIIPGRACRPFKRLNRRFKTPDTCILLNGFITLLMSWFFDFEQLVAVATVFYALRLMLEVASLLLLRHYYPLLERPMKIAVGMRGLLLVFTFPLCYAGVCMVLGLLESWRSGLLTAGLLLLSALIGAFMQFVLKRKLPRLALVDRYDSAPAEEGASSDEERNAGVVQRVPAASVQ